MTKFLNLIRGSPFLHFLTLRKDLTDHFQTLPKYRGQFFEKKNHGKNWQLFLPFCQNCHLKYQRFYLVDNPWNLTSLGVKEKKILPTGTFSFFRNNVKNVQSWTQIPRGVKIQISKFNVKKKHCHRGMPKKNKIFFNSVSW